MAVGGWVTVLPQVRSAGERPAGAGKQHGPDTVAATNLFDRREKVGPHLAVQRVHAVGPAQLKLGRPTVPVDADRFVAFGLKKVAHSAKPRVATLGLALWATLDRKSTRLNSSHQIISYAVFCLKK